MSENPPSAPTPVSVTLTPQQMIETLALVAVRICGATGAPICIRRGDMVAARAAGFAIKTTQLGDVLIIQPAPAAEPGIVAATEQALTVLDKRFGKLNGR